MRHRALILLATLFVTGVVCPAAGSDNSSADEAGGALELRLLSDAADGRLDQFTLLEASLIAGGVESDIELAQFDERFDQLCQALRQRMNSLASPVERGRMIFRFMHEVVLTAGYDKDCNQMSRTLSEGRFNCVTSVILYLCLGERFDLPITAVAEPGHVYCRLASAEPLDIETTCTKWFDIGVAVRHIGTSTDGSSRSFRAPGRGPEIARQIGNTELVARIYYNRGISRLADRQFANAVADLRTSCNLDPADAAARANLLAAINNWALSLCDSGDYEQAVQLLIDGQARAPDYEPLRNNDVFVHAAWIRHLYQSRRYNEALTILDRAHKRRPDVPLFDHARAEVQQAWLDVLPHSAETSP